MNALWPSLSELCRFYLLIALIVAAWSKTIGFGAFRKNLADAFPWPNTIVTIASMAVIIAEWAVAALMASPVSAYGIGGIAALGLFLLFTAVIAWSLITNRRIICSCFGESTAHRVSRYDLARNFLFVGAAALVALRAGTADEVNASFGLIEAMIFAGIAAVAFLVSTAIRDVVTLLQLPIDS